MIGTLWMARLARTGAAALLAASLGAGAAQAEGLMNWMQPSPRDIARHLERLGFGLRSALVLRGDVYVCDVFGASGDPERLVIAAYNGQILERFASRIPPPPRFAMARGYPAPDDFADPDGWARPPAAVGRLEAPRLARLTPGPEAGDAYEAPPRPLPAPKRVAKSDGTFQSLFTPTEEPPPPEIAKPKLHAKKRKPPAPEATPTTTADSPAAAPDAPPAPAVGVAAPASSAAGATVSAPPAPNPAATPAPKTASADAAEPAVAATDAKPSAPGPDTKPKARAINDLPVSPLD